MTNAPCDTARAGDGAAHPADVERRSVMMLGVVVERRPVANRWVSAQYLPVAVLPQAGPADWAPLALPEDAPAGLARWHAATVEVELHRSDSEAYLDNLNADRPAVYVVLRPSEDPDDAHDVTVVGATLSPFEAQDYLDSGDDIVEPVAIPDQVAAWVRDFVARHHKETPFKKRKRRPHVEEAPQFGKVLHPVERPFYERRDAVLREAEDDADADSDDGGEGTA